MRGLNENTVSKNCHILCLFGPENGGAIFVDFEYLLGFCCYPNTMVLYILFDSLLRGHSVQAIVAHLCQEWHQCHCKSIVLLLFP